MEYILVHFDSDDIRDVVVDGKTVLGKTECGLSIDAIYCEISLSGSGYTPARWTGTVNATSPASPLRISFNRVGNGAPPPPGRMRLWASSVIGGQ
jgi:hypothetical protein